MIFDISKNNHTFISFIFKNSLIVSCMVHSSRRVKAISVFLVLLIEYITHTFGILQFKYIYGTQPVLPSG